MDIAKRNGFTFVELIIVIVLLAIVSFIAYVRWPGDSMKLNAEAALLANDIRYTQNLAMTHGQRYRLVITSSSAASSTYQIQDSTGQPIILPSGNNTATVHGSVTCTNLPNNLIAFDGKGIPYVDTSFPGTPLSTVITPQSPTAVMQVAGAGIVKNILINPHTGSVSL